MTTSVFMTFPFGTMWISVESLAVLGQSGHFFKAAVARGGGLAAPHDVVVCFQERGEVPLSPRLLSLGEMSVAFPVFLWRLDAEDVDS